MRRSLVRPSSAVAAVLGLTMVFAIAPALGAAQRPGFSVDASATASVPAAVAAEFERVRQDPGLTRIATPAHVDDRFAVPSFLLATPAVHRR